MDNFLIISASVHNILLKCMGEKIKNIKYGRTLVDCIIPVLLNTEHYYNNLLHFYAYNNM